jgi:hypothetical protein
MADVNTALARFGADMFDLLFERFCEGDYEIELGDLIQIDAVKAGLVEKTKFDPERHTTDQDWVEPGDDYFTLTEVGREARKLRRTKESA